MDKEQIEKAFQDFKKSVKTLSLSTLDLDNRPKASYAPFIESEDGYFYILVSQLASHTQDLLANHEASILLLEDEKDSRQIFARQRISYQCQVETVDIEDIMHEPLLVEMETRFGNVIKLLRTLPDFILFRLKPYEGQYVKGFGKAYKLIGNSLQELDHISPDVD